MSESGRTPAPAAGGAALLDARGLACPLPVLKARKAMRRVTPGGLLRVLADDPAAPGDFAAFCEVTGHRMESSGAAEDGAFEFLIRARGRSTPGGDR